MEKDKADQVKKTIQLFASHRDQLNEVEQEILAVHGRIQDYGEELLSQRKHYQILQTATCYTCEAPLGNNNGDLAERKQKEIDLLQERIRQKEDELQYLYQERDRLLPLLKKLLLIFL
jgi:DNA repair exonuclease SbcCD ATPase subunit